jgi:hypothetical protein
VRAPNACPEGTLSHWRDIIGKEWSDARISRFVPGSIIFMYAPIRAGHARRSAVGDMLVGRDLLPTSATVNLIVTAAELFLHRRAVRREGGRSIRRMDCCCGC